MARIIIVLIAAAAVSLSGCVLKSEYAAKVAELDNVRTAKIGLESKLQDIEKQLAGLKQKAADLEKEKAQFQQENDNIKSTLETSRRQLSKDVVDLKNKLSENAAHIAQLEQELAARNKEIADLKAQADQLAQEKEKAVAQVKGTYESLVSELKSEINEGQIKITQLKDKLTVNMVDKILFDSGSAVIKRNGEKVLDRVADILKTVKNQEIKVEGHTDNVPISTRLLERFPSNWELSTARATMVVRYLQGRGVIPESLSAQGYAEYQPVAPNDTDENKAQNRRIEIVLLPKSRSK